MTDTTIADPSPIENNGFPYATVLATVAGLFLFVGLIQLVYRSPNYLGETRTESKSDPSEKLNEVRTRNKAVLEGNEPSVKLSSDQATAALLEHAAKSKDAKTPHGQLPFPMEPKKP
jgi:hypothetical protein